MITVHLNNKISFSLPTYDIGHFELSSDIEISLVALNWELIECSSSGEDVSVNAVVI